MSNVTILTGDPTIEIVSQMAINWQGVSGMADWVHAHRPGCLPDDYDDPMSLFPHIDEVTDNELLVELAGRKCYDSFGAKAGRKSNAEYIANTQQGAVPHRSIMYHAKMSFFIGGVSRRVSHELIRNYVGADRDEEGAPSQESTRFTHHYGFYVAAPRDVDTMQALTFESDCQVNYDAYMQYLDSETTRWARAHGSEPKGMDRKRIYEAASHRLNHSAETSFLWTTNPAALTKLFIERDNELADAEFQRFAAKWKKICVAAWPNLFQSFA